MKVENLHHKDILELDPEGGMIRFAGQRAIILDAVALGILRQYLVDNFWPDSCPGCIDPVRLCTRLANGNGHEKGIQMGK